MIFRFGGAPRAQRSQSSTAVMALIACVVTLAACAPPPLSVSVAFTSSSRGHILVPVSIDGSEPSVFILDTGAGKTLVTPRQVEKLGLAEAPQESVTTIGVHGTTENRVVELRSLAIGDARVSEIQAVVLDLGHITRGEWQVDGVLGMDFLGQFDVQLDFAASTLGLYAAALDPSNCAACPAGVEGIVFETIDPGFIVLPATVDEKPVKALLDTGSGHSGLNSKAATALGVTLPPMRAGASAGHGFGLQTGPVNIGDSTLAERTTLRVMDHPIMDSLGLADGPTMLIGTDQLAGRTMTICYGIHKLFLH